MSVCQSTNSSEPDYKIALVITAKCQLSGHCYIKLLLTSSHESINFRMKLIKEDLFGKIRLFVHMYMCVYMCLWMDLCTRF